MKVHLRVIAGGALLPDDEEAQAYIETKAVGKVLRADVVEPNNYEFHKKLMKLFRISFDMFEQNLAPLRYKGQEVLTNFDRFREDLTIMAGHYTATYAIDGTVRLRAKSLSFGNCSQEEREKVYSDVIDAALKHVFKQSVSEAQLRKMVDDILGFAG